MCVSHDNSQKSQFCSSTMGSRDQTPVVYSKLFDLLSLSLAWDPRISHITDIVLEARLLGHGGKLLSIVSLLLDVSEVII